jgi:hypothetical protein
MPSGDASASVTAQFDLASGLRPANWWWHQALAADREGPIPVPVSATVALVRLANRAIVELTAVAREAAGCSTALPAASGDIGRSRLVVDSCLRSLLQPAGLAGVLCAVLVRPPASAFLADAAATCLLALLRFEAAVLAASRGDHGEQGRLLNQLVEVEALLPRLTTALCTSSSLLVDAVSSPGTSDTPAYAYASAAGQVAATRLIGTGAEAAAALSAVLTGRAGSDPASHGSEPTRDGSDPTRDGSLLPPRLQERLAHIRNLSPHPKGDGGGSGLQHCARMMHQLSLLLCVTSAAGGKDEDAERSGADGSDGPPATGRAAAGTRSALLRLPVRDAESDRMVSRHAAFGAVEGRPVEVMVSCLPSLLLAGRAASSVGLESDGGVALRCVLVVCECAEAWSSLALRARLAGRDDVTGCAWRLLERWMPLGADLASLTVARDWRVEGWLREWACLGGCSSLRDWGTPAQSSEHEGEHPGGMAMAKASRARAVAVVAESPASSCVESSLALLDNCCGILDSGGVDSPARQAVGGAMVSCVDSLRAILAATCSARRGPSQGGEGAVALAFPRGVRPSAVRARLASIQARAQPLLPSEIRTELDRSVESVFDLF